MKHVHGKCSAFAAIIAGLLISPQAALATQGHGGIEGVYVHQMAHLFFIISMGVLIYWLRQRGLAKETGWRLIQFSALFFILWNLDTLLVHALDDQFKIIEVQRIETWQVLINDRYDSYWLKILYYMAKLDHLFCVPALVCLYLGLKRLLAESRLVTRTGEAA